MKALKLFFICLATVAVWSIVAFGAALYGWWMESVADDDDHEAFYHWAVNEIDTNNRGTAALVLIQDGAIVRRFFQGVVDEETLFPTASFSKWIAALAVMSLVEQNKMDLDDPVSRYLSRWQLPESEFDTNGENVAQIA